MSTPCLHSPRATHQLTVPRPRWLAANHLRRRGNRRFTLHTAAAAGVGALPCPYGRRPVVQFIVKWAAVTSASRLSYAARTRVVKKRENGFFLSSSFSANIMLEKLWRVVTWELDQMKPREFTQLWWMIFPVESKSLQFPTSGS